MGSDPDSVDVTDILRSVAQGESPASALFPKIYDELRGLASRHLREERPDHTLQATALVNEAYIRLTRLNRMEWRDRAHFLGVASGAIRRVLIDYARERGRKKRGGGQTRVSFDDALTLSADQPGTEILALDDAMRRLAEEHPEKSRVVELRYFGGLTVPEVAVVLGVTDRTVDRYWVFARNWLYRELN